MDAGRHYVTWAGVENWAEAQFGYHLAWSLISIGATFVFAYAFLYRGDTRKSRPPTPSYHEIRVPSVSTVSSSTASDATSPSSSGDSTPVIASHVDVDDSIVVTKILVHPIKVCIVFATLYSPDPNVANHLL